MKLDVPIAELFEIDVTDIRRCVLETPDAVWDVIDIRQKRYVEHRHTRSILFSYSKNNWRRGDPIDIVEHDYMPPELKAAVRPVGERLAAHYGGRVFKLIMVALRPNGHISSHSDEGDALLLVHRCHVPVITQAEVKMSIGGRPYHLGEGRAYEFDNSRLHSVYNPSDRDRVHIICDILDERHAAPAPDRRAKETPSCP